MKKVLLTLCVFLSFYCLFSCSDSALDKEIFQKEVYLVKNGFQEFEVNFEKSSVIDTTLSISVSGTQLIDRDVIVSLSINQDTLSGYNWERFRNDSSMYYELLPDSCYTLKKDNIVIAKGEELVRVPLTFNLSVVDKNKQYILPVEIASTSEYKLAEPRYRTVLINLILGNDYSGSYSLSGRLVEVGTSDETDVRMARTLRAEGPNSVSLYAGSTAENLEDREDYRMMLTVNADSTISFAPFHPDKITISADASNLSLDTPVNRIKVTETQDTKNSHRKYVTTYYYMQYNFTDKTLPDPVEMRWEGQASLTRTILIP